MQLKWNVGKDRQWKKSIRKHKLRRPRADVYLLRKDRQKKGVLLFVPEHEALEVLYLLGPCPWALLQLAIAHVVGILYREVGGSLSVDLHLKIERV